MLTTLVLILRLIGLLCREHRAVALENLAVRQQALRDRDAVYGDVFRRRIAGIGISEVVSSPSSPWQKDYASYCTSLV